MKITFLGGVKDVTGSRYLIEHESTKILVDCGLFQGSKEISQRNYDPFPVDPSSITAIILTHAHIDHTGYIPLLVNKGFRGKIYCSKATYAVCHILLIDSGSLHEKDMLKKNIGRSATVVLYTVEDAKRSLSLFQTVDYDVLMKINNVLTFKLISSYHILGASFVIISDGKKQLTFSGDLGRPNQLIMKTPPHLTQTDYLVLESTYGDRRHEEGDPIKAIGDVVNNTIKKGGILIIPSFAVGRTQTILYCLYELRKKNLIPGIPIFLDSPMAINVTNLFCDFTDEHKLSIQVCKDAFGIAKYTNRPQQSRKLYELKNSAIIIAGSGMASGGRVLNHFKHYISDAKNTVLFVGFQGVGTHGRDLVAGAKKIVIHSQSYVVRAEIKSVEMLSAHADYPEILDWLSYFKTPPKKLFLTHGEIEAARSLQMKIEERFGWSVVIPNYLESFDLD